VWRVWPVIRVMTCVTCSELGVCLWRPTLYTWQFLISCQCVLPLGSAVWSWKLSTRGCLFGTFRLSKLKPVVFLLQIDSKPDSCCVNQLNSVVFFFISGWKLAGELCSGKKEDGTGIVWVSEAQQHFALRDLLIEWDLVVKRFFVSL